MDEIKFHDSVADRFRAVATDITYTESGPSPSEDYWPEIEGVAVVGYIRDGVRCRQMIVWYEGRYLASLYDEYNGWADTSSEMDETFVVFTSTKPRKIIRYVWE